VRDFAKRKRGIGLCAKEPGRYFRRMSFAEPKKVLKLTVEQKAELAALLHGGEDDEWDRQMKADAEAGLLDGMVAEAKAEYAAGRTRPLP
jgi:hypothetical protein